MEFDLLKIDWTAIAAIVSFVMVFITWKMLKQNKIQLDEIKRQWDEQNRPYLSFTFKIYDGVLYFNIKNIGNGIADNIKLRVYGEFIDFALEYFRIGKNDFNGQLKDSFTLGKQQERNIMICFASRVSMRDFGEKDIVITARYNNQYDEEIITKPRWHIYDISLNNNFERFRSDFKEANKKILEKLK